jgi:hypothetical protein
VRARGEQLCGNSHIKLLYRCDILLSILEFRVVAPRMKE